MNVALEMGDAEKERAPVGLGLVAAGFKRARYRPGRGEALVRNEGSRKCRSGDAILIVLDRVGDAIVFADEYLVGSRLATSPVLSRAD